MPKKSEVPEPDFGYWKSLGWTFTQSLGLWVAEKKFEGFEEVCRIGNAETAEELEPLLQAAEEEFSKNSDGERGLAVVGKSESPSVFRGEQVVDLTDKTTDQTEASEESENVIDAEVEDVEPDPKPKAPHVFENLKVILTKDEKEKKTSELLQVMNTKDESTSRFESVKKSHQAEIKDLEKEIIRLRNVVDTGAEWRDVECEQKFDYARGIVDLFRVDTGVYVRSRPMKDAERQSALFK